MALNRIYRDDTALLEAALFEADEITPEVPVSVTWELRSPSQRNLIVSQLPSEPNLDDIVISSTPLTVNTILYPAWSVFEWDGIVWNEIPPTGSSTLTGNTASLSVPGAVINETGLYKGRARFTLDDSSVRSTPLSFESIDPFDDIGITDIDNVIDRAWMKLEDCFDSELGGPHLRDRTLAIFDKEKMSLLLPDALFNINNEFTPITSYTEENFPYNPSGPLLTQALLVETIYHLMRSYAEQPLPVGAGQISYFDRRDYLQRWQTILQMEETKYLRWLALFKNELMGFGSGALLVGGYATYARMPRFMRARYPRVIPPIFR